MRARALRFSGPGQVGLATVELRSPGPNEIMLRPMAVGLCGTDAHIIDGEFPAVAGITLGHEVAGTVESVGSAVDNVAAGDLVSIEPHIYCGHCRYCRLGREHLCLNKVAFGVHADGGLAEGMVVPARTAYPLPPGIDARIGCLAEPVGCCVHAMDRLGVISGASLAVIGAGPAGLILMLLARLQAATPVAVLELRPERRRVARELGADIVVDPSDEAEMDELMALTGGLGFDYVVEASGSGRALASAVRLAGRGATILVFGVARPTDRVEISPYEVFSRELSILGSVINPYTHERAVRLLPSLGLERLDVAQFGLGDFEAALAALREASATKVVVTPQSGQ